MDNQNYEQLGYFTTVVNVTYQTLSNYVREVKKNDPKFYEKWTMKKPRPKGGGRAMVFYRVDKWVKLFEGKKEHKKQTQGRKANKPTKKKHKHKMKADTITQFFSEGEEVEKSNLTITKRVDLNDHKSCWVIFKTACDFYLTGNFSPQGAAEQAGITVEAFYKIATLNEEFEDYWNKVRANWCNRYKNNFEFWMYNRSLEILTRKTTKVTTTKYKFEKVPDQNGQLVDRAVPVDKTEREVQFTPKGSDLLFAQKSVHELELKYREYMPPEIEVDVDAMSPEEQLEYYNQLYERWKQLEDEEGDTLEQDEYIEDIDPEELND